MHGGVALDAAYLVRCRCGAEPLHKSCKLDDRLCASRIVAVVAQAPLEDSPRIEDLSSDEACGNEAGPVGVLRSLHLRHAQQHIAGNRPFDTREKAPVLRKKAHMDAPLAAESEKEWAA